ncbi:uncharacterized protein LOC134254107 isoform X2 [Saccostrea cucullata]|uniref:uncharacterized protein LOC134254107 isoform X2 n=1 Tax=Saccostrea cuccullata TaxID=36930 RepID=UPI002ED45FE3
MGAFVMIIWEKRLVFVLWDSLEKLVLQPLFGNTLLPKQLICYLHEECELYLLVSERNGFLINTIMNSSNILEINKTRISKDYLVTLTLVTLKHSVHNLCVNISQQRSSIATDMVCCSISTKKSDTNTYGACNDDTDDCRDPRALHNICSDQTTAIYCRKSCKLCRSIPINREKELFSRPSPQNSSIYTCSPGVECHMLLYMYSGDNESCPSVSVLPTADITVHIFNNYNGDRCSVDILIKPFSSHPGQLVNLCVKASSHDSK